MNLTCPCGSGISFQECCQKNIDDRMNIDHPEKLMRARYSAFVVKKIDFLVDTLDLQIRSVSDYQDYFDWANKAQFNKLEVISSSVDNNKGTVEFKAYYQEENKYLIMHEISQFRKQKGIWYYRNGKVNIYEDSSFTHSR